MSIILFTIMIMTPSRPVTPSQPWKPPFSCLANAEKYMQCGSSPFLCPPLLNLLGYLPSTHSESILDGTFHPPADTPYFAWLLLQHMTRPASAALQPEPPPKPFVDTTDHIQSWTHAKEYTTAGLSGIHFGMYKAQVRDPDLTLYDAALRSIPYRTGIHYD